MIDDFYLGIDALTAALTALTVYVCDLYFDQIERAVPVDVLLSHVFKAALYGLLLIFLLIFVLITHKQADEIVPTECPCWHFWKSKAGLLGGLSNTIGFGGLGCFLLFL